MITVALSRYNQDGYVAHIENDDEMDMLQLCDFDDPAETCLEAASILRELADRFEKLSKEPKPCHTKTHERINAEDMK